MEHTHTQSSLFPPSGDEVEYFQIYSRRSISYQIVTSLVVDVFTSKVKIVHFSVRHFVQYLQSMAQGGPSLLKKTSAKTLFTTQLSDSVMTNLKQYLSIA